MEFIKNFFIALDIFKCPINLFFLSKQKISTTINIILSLLIYSLLIVFFLNSDYFNKKNPQISDQILDGGQTSIPLNNDNYGVYFTFYDYNNNYYSALDPSCVHLEIWQIFYSSLSQKNINIEKVPLESCLIDNSSAFCLKNNWNVFLNVSNDMWNGDYSYFQFQIKYCNNQTSGMTCKPTAIIEQYLDGMYFSINFLEYNFDMKSLEQPVTRTYSYRKWILNQDIYQSYAYSLMRVELYQDESSVYNEDEVIFGSYLQEDPRTYSNFYSNANINNGTFNETLFDLEIYPSRNKRELIRKYQKLTDVISSLGGLATALQFFFGIIANFSIKIMLLKMITKNLYFTKKMPIKFSMDAKNIKIDKSQKDIIEDENKIHQINESTYFQAITGRNIKDVEFELQLNPEKNEKLKPPPPLDLNMKVDENQNILIENEKKSQMDEQMPNLSKCDFVKYHFRKLFRCKFNKKDQLIERSEQRFQKDFDFAVILRKLMNLGKLQLIIFNEKQRRIFNSIENFDEDSLNTNNLLQSSILLKNIKIKEKLENYSIDKRLEKLYDLCSNKI